jgi:hypothetical protein
MGMVAEVLHPATAQRVRWNWTTRMNYLKALLTKLPLAFYNWFVHYRIEHISDAECAGMLTNSSYSKFLRRYRAADLMETDFRAHVDDRNPARPYLISDFTPMREIEPHPGVFVAPTIVLYARDHDEAPWALHAISIGHRDGEAWKHVVLTPDDGAAWTLAKYFAIQGAGHMIALTGHPATHFPYDTVNAVTVSALPVRHTLFKLLKPHLDLHLAVDNAVLEGGHSIVSETRGEFYAPFAGPSDQVRKLVAVGYIGYPSAGAEYRSPPKPGPNYLPWTYPTGAGDIPSTYGRFLAAYYATVRRFVSVVVAHIDDLAEPLRGEELYYIRCWARYIAHWLPGFPDEDEILAPDPAAPGERYPRLVTVLTTFVWDVAVAHSLEHCTFGKLGPHRTSFRVRVPPPDSAQAPAYARSEILSGWDMFKSTLAFEIFFKPHNITLLKDVHYGFESESLRAAAEQFRRELRQTEERLRKDRIDVDAYARLDEMACSIQY